MAAVNVPFECPECKKNIATIFGGLNEEGSSLHHDYSYCMFSVEFLELFKEHVNDENDQGKTPLRCLIENYHLSWEKPQKSTEVAVKALLIYGADPCYMGKCGSSALDYAREKKMSTIIEMFDVYDYMVKECDCE